LPHATLSSKIYKSFRFGKDAKLGGGARFSKKADGISRIYNKNLEMGKSRVFQNGLKMSE
jgi:hypothetical protein